MLVQPMTDYRSLIASYSRPGSPETFNYCDVIATYAQDRSREAMIWANDRGEERNFTFADVDAESCRIADVLRTRGVGKGDRVLVMLPRIPEWQFTMLAVFRLGAIAIPSLTMLQPKDLEYRLELATPKAVVTTGREVSKFDGLLVRDEARLFVPDESGDPVGWEDLAKAAASARGNVPAEPMRADEGSIIYFTSGSTGMPKGVEHSAYFARSFYEVAAYWLDLNEQSKNDTVWCTADTGWSLCATGVLIGPWLAGVRVFFYDGPFDAAKRLQLMEKYGITVYLAAATEYRHLVAQKIEDYDLSRLRLSATAGESLDATTLRGWMERAGCRMHEAYGQTESLMTIANYPGTEIRPGSMGLPFPGSRINVISQETHEVAPQGEVGMVAIKMPTKDLMLGYWKDSAKTSECFVENAKDERWFVTGDLASKDKDGYFWYAGRNDDVINAAGYRIGPTEVEAVVMDHSAVRECACIASPDQERGFVVKAFIVLNDGFTGSPSLMEEIKNFVKSRTAPYKYPRKIEFVDTLPMTPSGKIRRNVLRELEAKRCLESAK